MSGSETSEEKAPFFEMGGVQITPGMIIGNYCYVRPIGKGGMANVLLAVDPNNRNVALKVLKANRFKTGKRRFRREFRSVARINHPNVIRVYSFGDYFSHPYIAMEFIEGVDLHTTIRSFKEMSLSFRWERSEEILTDLSKGLACIHKHGLIHRDLKPSNILIDSQGTCKISDFGIVKSINTDLEQSTTLVGTWAYASPEQISGQLLDHRSDLYSLGIILYAMLTGRRPFAAENMAGYLKLHKDKLPMPPSHLISSVPKKLEHICLKLLQKSPGDRFQSANEILDVLGHSSSTTPSLIEELSPWRAPLVGREKILKKLKTHIHQLTEGDGATIQIIGGDGLGKSRMLLELYKELRTLNHPVFQGRLSPHQSPLEMLLLFAEYISRETGDLQIHAIVNKIEESFSSKTTSKIQLQRNQANLKNQLFDRIQTTLQEKAQERPLFFLIDNLHYAGGPLQELINFLTRSLLERAQLPLLLIGTADSMQTWLHNTHRYALPPLSEENILEILTSLCGSQPDLDLFSEQLFSQTEGIPVFVVEFLRDLLRRNILLQGDPHTFSIPPRELAKQGLDVPLSLRQLARRRLELLSPLQKKIVLTLSIIGQEIDIDTLLDIINLEEDQVLDEIHYLCNTGTLYLRRIGLESIVELSRRKLGEIFYEEISYKERTTMHFRIASILERHRNHQNRAQQIGEHYLQSRRSGNAFFYLAKAIHTLWDQGIAKEALSLLQKTLPLLRDAKAELKSREFIEARIRILQVQFLAAENSGDWKVATKYARSLLRYGREFKDFEVVAKAELGLSRIFLEQGSFSDAEQRIRGVLRAAEELSNHSMQILALHHLCAICWEQGDLDRSEHIAKLGLQAVGENALSKANILLSLGAINAIRCRVHEAEKQMLQAERIYAQLQHKKKRCIVLSNLAEIQLWQSNWSSALENLERSMDLAQDTYHQAGLAQVHLTYAMVYFEMGLIREFNLKLALGTEIANDLSFHSSKIVATLLSARSELFYDTPLSALDTAKRGQDLCLISDPESYAPVFEAMSLLSSVLLKDIDSVQTTELLKKAEHLPTSRRLDILLIVAEITYHTGKQQQAYDQLKLVVHLASKFGLWLWSLKANHLLFRLLELSDSDKSLEQRQELELILAQSTLKMPADIKKRMDIFFLQDRESSTFFRNL